MRRLVLVLYLTMTVGMMSAQPATAQPSIDDFLQREGIGAGIEHYRRLVAENPDDPDPHFALGVLQFLQGIEHFVQAQHRHGFLNTSAVSRGLPFVRSGVLSAPDPLPLGYDDLRAIFERLRGDLREAEATLAAIPPGEVLLPIHVGLARLDINASGELSPSETLWQVLNAVQPGLGLTDETAAQWLIHFDRGDAIWLRAYCNLLLGLLEIENACDYSELFNRAGHLVFARPATPFAGHLSHTSGFDEITDIIALIHLISFPVEEAEALQRAHGHLLRMTELSRQSWEAILAETDDDREWIPNPHQQGFFVTMPMTEERVNEWLALLDECSHILRGELLIPFWRGTSGQGVNLRRVFHEMDRFDLVLWVQGSGAVPYLEQGALTQFEFWERMNRVFSGNLIGFSVWLN